MKKNNEKTLVIYLYLSTIMLLATPLLSSEYIFYLRNISMLLLSIFAFHNNKFKLNYKIIIFFSMSVCLISLNILFVNHQDYVIVELLNFLIYWFTPIYLINIGKLDYKKLMDEWFKFARKMTLLLPVFMFLSINDYINYYQIGYYAHLNIIILSYYYFSKNNNKITTLMLIIIYTIVSLIISFTNSLLNNSGFNDNHEAAEE